MGGPDVYTSLQKNFKENRNIFYLDLKIREITRGRLGGKRLKLILSNVTQVKTQKNTFLSFLQLKSWGIRLRKFKIRPN